MSAEIFRFRPALRLVEARRPTPRAAQVHFESELRQVALKLAEAADHFRMLASEPVNETAIVDGAEALEAALLCALKIKGMPQTDDALAKLIERRVAQREEACRD